MSSSRKSRLTRWLSRARQDLDNVAAEIEGMDDRGDRDEATAAVGKEVDEVRARVDALEYRVQAIEGTPS